MLRPKGMLGCFILGGVSPENGISFKQDFERLRTVVWKECMEDSGGERVNTYRE